MSAAPDPERAKWNIMYTAWAEYHRTALGMKGANAADNKAMMEVWQKVMREWDQRPTKEELEDATHAMMTVAPKWDMMFAWLVSHIHRNRRDDAIRAAKKAQDAMDAGLRGEAWLNSEQRQRFLRIIGKPDVATMPGEGQG